MNFKPAFPTSESNLLDAPFLERKAAMTTLVSITTFGTLMTVLYTTCYAISTAPLAKPQYL